MSKIKTSYLKPQMILAEDVCDKSGRLLAAKGTVFTEHQQIVFNTWGITEVEILDNSLQDNPGEPKNLSQVTSAQVEQTFESLRPLFRLNDLDHPFIQELLYVAAGKKASKHDR